MENKRVRKLLSLNKKSLRMEPIFIDEDGTNITKYFLFGAHSLNQCLYRQQMDDDSFTVHDGDDEEYRFKNEEEMEENEGVHFGNLEIVGCGLEGIREFAAKIDGVAKPDLYQFFLNRLSEMELLEKKKMREERREKMRQQRLQRDFMYKAVETATYDDENGNRRSMRMKGKKKSYKEQVDSDGDGHMDDGDSEFDETEEKRDQIVDEMTEMTIDGADEEVADEPLYYPSGRPRRSGASRKKVTYRY